MPCVSIIIQIQCYVNYFNTWFDTFPPLLTLNNIFWLSHYMEVYICIYINIYIVFLYMRIYVYYRFVYVISVFHNIDIHWTIAMRENVTCLYIFPPTTIVLSNDRVFSYFCIIQWSPSWVGSAQWSLVTILKVPYCALSLSLFIYTIYTYMKILVYRKYLLCA